MTDLIADTGHLSQVSPVDHFRRRTRPPIMASEDFAVMLQRVPGCYLWVGNGSTGTVGGCSVHNPRSDFNDELIVPMGAFWRALVQTYLAG